MSTLTRVVLESTSGLAASPVSASAINLTWTANTRATGYRVYRNGTLIGSPTANSYGDTGLAASTSYTYTVSTVAATGEGPQTAGVQGTTLAAPDTTAPTAPVITATATGQNTISVALTTPATDAQSGVASYDLEYKRAADATYSVITPVTAGQFPYIVGSLTAATAYNTRSRARDVVGNVGAYSTVSNATTQASTGGTDPYPLYTSFDRNAVPWHTAAGSWGPQAPIVAPTLPATTRSVTVNSLGEFNAQAAIAGTLITIGSGWTGNSVATINANDVDVILPAGVSIGAVELGGWPRQTPISRVRVRGSAVAGQRGGRMGQFRGEPAPGTLYSDVVLDGIDMNGDSGFGGGETNQCFRANVTRMFIHNVRAIAAGYVSQAGGPNWVIANSNMFSGASTRAAVGYPEGWCWRTSQGPLYFIDCDLQTTRYHVLRPQTYDAAGELMLVKNCNIINLAEGQMIWGWNRVSEPAFGFGLGTVVEDSRLYSGAQSACGNGDSQAVSLNTCTYSRIRRNAFYSQGVNNRENRTLATLQSDRALAISNANSNGTLISRGRAPLPADAHTSDAELTTNTFATLTGHPGWRGPGDPRAVPLPAGLTLSQGEGTCPAIWS